MKLILRPLLRSVAAALLCLVATTSPAQDPAVSASNQSLTLFEAVETAQDRGRAVDRPTRESRVTTAEPEFTLVGVSRIGSNYSAILKHREGENILVKADSFANTRIPGHGDYAVVDISAGAVSISFPGSNACMEFSDRGVTCNSAGNIAELVLATGEPLAPRNPARGDSQADGDSSEEVIAARSDPNNPFEMLRNARRIEAGDAAGNTPDNPAGRFTPRRINPEDVPDGYRVVATPFGDRLVEQ